MSDEGSVSLGDQVRRAAIRDAGFDAVGIAIADPPPYPGVLRDWLHAGSHAGMAWMTRRVSERESTRGYMPGAKSIVCIGLNTFSALPCPQPIAMYARGEDYHRIFKEKLATLRVRLGEILPGVHALACCDTSPVLERAYAERAGIGWIGRSSQLISGRFGTWLLLGEILLDRALPADPPHLDRCGTCDRCVRACPTGAISGGRRVDARRCISYFTIEHRGPFPDTITASIAGHPFGCDDCLRVCPFNRFQCEASEPRLRPGVHLAEMIRIPAFSEVEFRERFGRTSLARAGYGGMKRNLDAAVLR